MNKANRWTLFFLLLIVFQNSLRNSFGDERGQKVETDSLEKKYWSKGSENSVIENRQFTKNSRLELSLMGGMQYVDPFLDVLQYGGSLSYFFSEHWGASIIGWSVQSKASTAQAQLALTGKTAKIDAPQLFIGAEAVWAPLYGKLSLLGWKFLAYDLAFTLGIGQNTTQNTSSFGPIIGVGQRFHINEYVSLGIDYRKGYQKELVAGDNIRTNWPDYVFGALHFIY